MLVECCPVFSFCSRGHEFNSYGTILFQRIHQLVNRDIKISSKSPHRKSYQYAKINWRNNLFSKLGYICCILLNIQYGICKEPSIISVLPCIAEWMLVENITVSSSFFPKLTKNPKIIETIMIRRFRFKPLSFSNLIPLSLIKENPYRIPMKENYKKIICKELWLMFLTANYFFLDGSGDVG